jgi:dihydrofolate reductase
MALIEAYISMSADGYVTGPGLDREPGLGEGGKVLHEWFAHDEGRPYLDELFAVSGAVVTSRKVYEITGGWGEDGLYRMPVFVVTHRPEGQVVKGDTTFTFVTDGIDAALTQAAEAAGDKRVYVMGGASIIQQSLRSGLVEQLQLHIVPVLLGAGTRLFDHLGGPIQLEHLATADTPGATHLTYRVLR